MADIFISYARSTEAQAERIAGLLRALGHDVWRDNEIPAHRSFADVIEERLRNARAVLVIWSAEAVKSEWVQSEADAARIARKMVQLRIDGAKLPMPFDRIQCANLEGWTGDPEAPGWKMVAASLAELTGGARPDFATAAGPAQASRPLLGRRRLAIGALAAVLALAAGAAALKWANPFAKPRPAATVQLASFKAVGTDVPADLPTRIYDDARDAFGEDNAVTLKDRNADFELRGDVRKVDERFRYSVQLHDVGDGTLVWSSSREWPASAARGSREAAIYTTQAVRCGLRGAAEHPRRLPRHTLGLFLQLCEGQVSPEGALELSRKIVAEAPDFARGWSGLAVWASAGSNNPALSPAAKQALRAEGERAAAKALRLDPRNGQVYDAQALLVPSRDRVERERLLRRAAESHLTDCGCELITYALFLSETGRLQAANQLLRRAFELQPLGWETNVFLANSYDKIGQTAQADQGFAKAAPIYGDNVPFQLANARHTALSGRWKESIQWVSANAKPPFQGPLIEAESALQSGDPARIAAARPGMEGVARAAPNNRDFLGILVAMGSQDQAFDLLDAAMTQDVGVAGVLFTPQFMALRHDPRYARLMETSGLMDYWRASKTRPDMCAAADAPSFCKGL